MRKHLPTAHGSYVFLEVLSSTYEVYTGEIKRLGTLALKDFLSSHYSISLSYFFSLALFILPVREFGHDSRPDQFIQGTGQQDCISFCLTDIEIDLFSNIIVFDFYAQTSPLMGPFQIYLPVVLELNRNCMPQGSVFLRKLKGESLQRKLLF